MSKYMSIFEQEREEKRQHQAMMSYDGLIHGGKYGLSNWEKLNLLLVKSYVIAKATGNKHSFKIGAIGIKKCGPGKDDFVANEYGYGIETMELVSNLNSPYKSVQQQLKKSLANCLFMSQYPGFAKFLVDSKIVVDNDLVEALNSCKNENQLENVIKVFDRAIIAKHITIEDYDKYAKELEPAIIKKEKGKLYEVDEHGEIVRDTNGNLKQIKSDSPNFAYVNTLDLAEKLDSYTYPESDLANKAREVVRQQFDAVTDKYIEAKSPELER